MAVEATLAPDARTSIPQLPESAIPSREKSPRVSPADALRSAGAKIPPYWRSIDTAPKDGTPILIWNGECVIGWWETRKEFSEHFNDWSSGDARGPSGCDCGFERIYNPTHWMPLPEAPEGV